MKKVIYIFLSLVLIIISFFAYHSYTFYKYTSNPIDGDMNIPINGNAPVKSTNLIEINAPIDTVWKILTDIKNWTQWQKEVSETVVHGTIKEETQFDWKAGGLSFKSKIHTARPKSMFGWTGTTLGASAIHNWTFEAKENKTIVRVEESLQGVFPNLLRSYFQKNLDAGIMRNLKELKNAAEASESHKYSFDKR